MSNNNNNNTYQNLIKANLYKNEFRHPATQYLNGGPYSSCKTIDHKP